MSYATAPAVSTLESTAGNPDPILVWDTLNAYQRTAALDAALELDLFTAVAEGHQTAARLAQFCKGSERGVRILCDYLTTIGFFSKEKGEYKLTPTSAVFLNRHSPAFTGSVARFLNMPELIASFGKLTNVVRTGRTALEGNGTVDPNNPIWVVFAKSMTPMIAPTAEFVASLVGAQKIKMRVLDIAAGHGLFGIGVAKRNPAAEIFAVDWPGVLEVASENARQAGVAKRHRLLPGDAFEVDFEGPYELVLLTNFLHHFSESVCVKLLKKIRRNLKPGGRLITVEFVPNEDRVSPPVPAAFSLIMLAHTPEGDAYTFGELNRMFTAAGFGASEAIAVPDSPQTAIVTHRN